MVWEKRWLRDTNEAVQLRLCVAQLDRAHSVSAAPESQMQAAERYYFGLKVERSGRPLLRQSCQTLLLVSIDDTQL